MIRYRRKKELKKMGKSAVTGMLLSSAVFLILFFAAKRIAALYPDLVEKHFSRGLYPFTSNLQTGIANLIPFSLYETILVLVVLFCLYRLIRLVYSLFRRCFAAEAVRFTTQILLLVSIGLFLFQFLWNLNNYRIPLKDQLGLTLRETSVNELSVTYQALVECANKTRAELSASQDTTSSPEKTKLVLDTAWEGYPPLALKYTVFHTNRVRVKGLFFSHVQTISGYGGVYSFISGEPNINTEPPLVTRPHAACHEIAHQMGITLEDEANYSGFLACRSHSNILFVYSGYLSALTYTGNALYQKSPERYDEISSHLSDEIRADQQENREFWDRWQNKTITEAADRINEAYLKNNNQPEGMQSYGKFVDLLIADFLEDGEI